MRCHVVRAGTVLALAAASAHPLAQQSQGEPQVFRSGVQLIEVDVRVFDRGGRFIPDLGREDFTILENGVEQKIEAVSLHGIAASADVGDSAAPPTAATQVWIFFFDTNHLVPGAGFDRAKQAVTEFLKAGFRAGHIGGILVDGRIVNNRLSSVREELVSAVAAIKPNSDARTRQIELTREWPRLQDEREAILIANDDAEALRRAIQRACSDDADACRQLTPDLQIRSKARRFLSELEQATRGTLNDINALASGLAKVPGPKTIVLLSDGFVTERMEGVVQQVSGQMARAGGRLYAIDVRGLNRGRGAGIIDQPAVDNTSAPAQFDARADGPNSLAVDTGGLMIRNENNIGRALETVAADANTYYVLAYRPTDQSFDGKFRMIDVRVNRPGVRVRARRGYLALEPSRLLVPRPLTAPDPQRAAAAGESPAGPPAVEPVEPLPSPMVGKLVEGTTASDPTHVRLRPDAAERLRQLAGDEKTQSGALAEKGWAAYERGDVETAVGAFEEAAKAPDVRPWVLYALGLSKAALADPGGAAAAWERVRDAAPGFNAVYIDLADAYLQLSESAKALEVLREGSRRWPADPEFHNAIGVIHVRRGALDEGIAAFTRAAGAAPDEPLAYFNLGRAYQMRHARDTRYVASQRRWISPENDRRQAIEHYKRYLQLGGPYSTQASEAISMLEWAKR